MASETGPRVHVSSWDRWGANENAGAAPAARTQDAVMSIAGAGSKWRVPADDEQQELCSARLFLFRHFVRFLGSSGRTMY